MSVPEQIDDGNWGETHYETVDINYPFSGRGDDVSIEFTATFTIDKRKYNRRAVGTEIEMRRYDLRGYLVDPGSPRDIGNGLFKISRTYASVPNTREEKTSISLTIPILFNQPLPDVPRIESFTRTFSGYTKFEYSLTEFEPLFAFDMFILQERVYKFGSDARYGRTIPEPGPYLAQDSEVGIYKSIIFYRKSTYAIIPPAGIFRRDF